MDVAASWDIPNAFGLLSSDFDYALADYRIALGFLSDLAGGTEEQKALTQNGGSQALLTAWKGRPRFRRVYGKCQAAGRREREAGPRPKPPEDTEHLPPPGQQAFVRAEDVPTGRGGVPRLALRGSR